MNPGFDPDTLAAWVRSHKAGELTDAGIEKGAEFFADGMEYDEAAREIVGLHNASPDLGLIAAEGSKFDPDTFADYVFSHGLGAATEAGIKKGAELFAGGMDYAEAGAEVVTLGELKPEMGLIAPSDGPTSDEQEVKEDLPEPGDISPVQLDPVHPIQPLYLTQDGVIRFKESGIVRKLLDFGHSKGYGLNEIVRDPDTTREDLVQLYQLMGYSLDGYGELQAVTDADYNAASAMADDPTMDSQAARIAALEGALSELRILMATPVATLYGIHEDDLKHGRP